MFKPNRCLSSFLFNQMSFFVIPLLVIISSILLNWEVAYTDSFSCSSNRFSLHKTIDNETARTYTISGTCVASSEFSVENFGVDVTSIWNKSSGTGIEVVNSLFGTLTRTFSCDYDPWLEPASKCKMTSHDYKHKIDENGYPVNSITDEWIFRVENWWIGYEEMNSRISFPSSTLVMDHDSRSELISKAMTRTLKIIDPVQNQSFGSPDLMVTVVMERPVINPPDYPVAIKVEEFAWPEAGVTTTNRKYEEGKKYLKTAKQLITYFNLKDKDLWGAKWGVSAHVVSKEPGWTPITHFTVNSQQDSALSDPPENTLPPPQIHTPRANHTYSIEGDIPLKITYDPEAELSISYSSRPAGNGDYKHFVTWWYVPEHTSHPGQVELDNFIKGPAQFGGAEIVEVKVEAYIKKMQGGVTLKSDPVEVVARILVPKPKISKPEENKKYSAPAEVNLIIIKSYGGSSDSWKRRIEMEVLATGQGNSQTSDLFLPYSDDSYVVSEVFNTVLIKYKLKNVGKYSFRARFVNPESLYTESYSTPWTDWKQIEVVGNTENLSATGIFEKKTIQSIQKVENKQLKQASSAERLQPQSGKVVPVVKIKKPGFKLKTVPVFIQPQTHQEIGRRGSVRLQVKGVVDKDQLDWQLEYKKFGSSKYNKTKMARARVIPGTNQVTGAFYVSKDGEYRIRVRSKEKGSRWSSWRVFSVGKPTVKKIQKTISQPSIKESLEEENPAPEIKKTELKKPKTIKPSVQKEKPRIIEPVRDENKPIIMNNP